MDICNIRIFSVVLVCLLSLNIVSALGVSSPYWDNNPLKMHPGEEKEVTFILVNRPDAETTEASITLLNDGGIAKITSGNSYSVKPGTGENVVFNIKVPANAEIGNTYNIEFEVKSSNLADGQIELTLGYNVKFPVQVVSKSGISPESPTTPQPNTTSEATTTFSAIPIITIIIIAILLIILIFWLLKRKKASLNN